MDEGQFCIIYGLPSVIYGSEINVFCVDLPPCTQLGRKAGMISQSGIDAGAIGPPHRASGLSLNQNNGIDVPGWRRRPGGM